MIESKKVKREGGSIFSEFLNEKSKNIVEQLEQKLTKIIFQKNETIRNLLLENGEYRIKVENREFENNELK